MKKSIMLFQMIFLFVPILSSIHHDQMGSLNDCFEQRVYVHQLITAVNPTANTTRYFLVKTTSDKIIYLKELDANGIGIGQFEASRSIGSGLDFRFEMKYVQDFETGSDGRYQLVQVLRPVATFKWCKPWTANIRS